MKRSRPLSLFLSVLILISCLTVSVSAESSGNLIDSNLLNWDKWNEEYIYVSNPFNTGGYRFQVSPEFFDAGGTPLNIWTGALYDLTNLSSGSSYSLNFHLLSPSEAGFPDEKVYNAFEVTEGTLFIGLASYNSSIDNIDFVEDCYIAIHKDNYSNYFGTDININFTLPNIVNPCIVICYLCAFEYESAASYSPAFDFKNFKLIDTEQEKENGFFDKLFQFFHDLKWEIVGGSCGDSDCNKSPHTSLADKITNKVEELKESFTDLRDSIDGFFDEFFDKIADFFGGFGNLILYFNWEGDYTNPFEREDSPIDKVSAFFDNLIEYVDSIGTSIENVLDSVTGGFYIFDEFTKRFPWIKALAVFCLALIVITRFIGL